ncbi:hypothetical protein [Bifidobacterium castoris]|uniref:Uncharacterized protein n=1 Tax=Bifidobacterium castoris TaxID=2306972 RepID=A0A430FAF5_9BIFI|nr:hypothetical protein [Bifidobacterium castoris]RSX49820.1 hypothetical protein D2E22_0281 [Bifidobacterium castoris]
MVTRKNRDRILKWVADDVPIRWIAKNTGLTVSKVEAIVAQEEQRQAKEARSSGTSPRNSTARSNPQRVRNQRPRQGVIMRSEHVTINGRVGKISKCGKA